MRNKLLYAILSLLGLTIACSKDTPDEGRDDYDGGMCMYGTPTVTFSAKGRVTDTEGEPIGGIRVNVEHAETFTDILGAFDLKDVRTVGSGDATLTRQLEFHDVDGEENGSFEDRKIDMTFTRDNDVKSGPWYLGDYKTQDTDVVLQTKKKK